MSRDLWTLAMIATFGWLVWSATQPKPLTVKEQEAACIMAILSIEQDVGKWDRDLVCDIAKRVTATYDDGEHKIDCSRICKTQKEWGNGSDKN